MLLSSAFPSAVGASLWPDQTGNQTVRKPTDAVHTGLPPKTQRRAGKGRKQVLEGHLAEI